jgi:HlyD family secretion protein
MPFLPAEPPPWAARALSAVLLALFGTAIVASLVIRVPETVSGPFVLVPVAGVDPIRAAVDGTVTEVRRAEGQAVEREEVLFVVRSMAVGERSAELASLETRVAGIGERAAHERASYLSQHRIGTEERARLDDRLAHLRRKLEETRRVREIQETRYRARRTAQEAELRGVREEIAVKRSHLALAREMAERYRTGHERGFLSWVEYVRPQMDAERAAADLARLERQLERTELALRQLQAERETEELEWTRGVRELETEIRDVRGAQAKRGHESDARLTAHRELERGLQEELERARIRIAALRQALPRSRGSELSVVAPCAGTLLRLGVRAPGAVVREGETLAEVACAGGPLEAELTVPAGGVSRIQAGQGAKLLYDAFPYQRHGARLGTVRWVTPAGVSGGGEARFRARVTLAESALLVDGQPRLLLGGMSGTAQVVVGRHPLIAYAVEPLRQVRENLAGAPGR